jgi:HrpA-like RNA helicase
MRVSLGKKAREAVTNFLKQEEEKLKQSPVAATARPPQPPADSKFECNTAILKDELDRLAATSAHAEMLACRRELPAHIHRHDILSAVNNHPITLLRGATGCGKSTQLPQLLLEDAVSKGLPCRIVCAQPRRLAATALAERVAQEMADGSAGGLCGYRIRGESKVSPRTALTFVTTGILLRQLENEPALDSLTHVVVDEVHERSVDVELLLLILRRLLLSPAVLSGQRKPPTIILMSATVDASAFVEYFSSACKIGYCCYTVLNTLYSLHSAYYTLLATLYSLHSTHCTLLTSVCDVPGRTFPVTELFLEDALLESRYVCSANSSSGWGRQRCTVHYALYSLCTVLTMQVG